MPAVDRILRALPFPLTASSAVSFAFFAARGIATHHPGYSFLLWNLTLAWIPYVLARVIVHRASKGAHVLSLAALGVVFIGFLPNAPYIVTDLMHLHHPSDAPYWFDALMLASFAWSGLTLGIASVRLTAKVIERRVSRTASMGYVGIVSVLSAFGIYLGRFVRLNTWDAVTHPFRVARAALLPVVHPFAHVGAWCFTVAFAALFLASYATLARRRA
jgi:uncharacterized membrane protein